MRRARRHIASWKGRAAEWVRTVGRWVDGVVPKGMKVHIEPGIVEGPKLIISYVTAGGAGLYALRAAWQLVKERGVSPVLFRSLATTVLVFTFFQVFPHYPVGVSEVHLIFGSTLFLLFGMAPAAIGLSAGLLLQGLFFAPLDLPQYCMNLTTLLVPLFGLQYVASRMIAPNTPYVQLHYRQALALSTTYQAGIVSWVGFWALYGEGFTIPTVQSIAAFGASYVAVIALEPLADLAVLAAAKGLHRFKDTPLLERRLLNPA